VISAISLEKDCPILGNVELNIPKGCDSAFAGTASFGSLSSVAHKKMTTSSGWSCFVAEYI